MIKDWEESKTEPVMLAGEFHCRLTSAERNEWFRFTENNSHLNWLLKCGAMLEHAKFHEDRFVVQDAVRDYLGAVSVMHRVAAEWFEGVKARRADAANSKSEGAA